MWDRIARTDGSIDSLLGLTLCQVYIVDDLFFEFHESACPAT
jgi:hypothetical protein